MAVLDCLPEKLSKLALGIIFIVFGLGATVIGVTIIPVFGLLLAVILFVIGGYFIRSHLNQQCEIGKQG